MAFGEPEALGIANQLAVVEQGRWRSERLVEENLSSC